MAEAGDKRGGIVGISLRVVRSAGDGNIRKAGVYQLGVNIGVDVDEHALGGESLRAVAGDSIAMIEVPHLVRIEGYGFAVIHADGDWSIFADLLNHFKPLPDMTGRK
ncbi:MAG: hypothetical protein ACYDHM_16800 [Acidiferrobacterales bacterium]